MKLLSSYFNWRQKYLYVLGCLTCLLMTMTTTAVAEYKKPKTTSAPDPKTTTSTATRGGCMNLDRTDLTAIAPYSHVGQTTSTHPTFVWFIPDSEYFPLEFHLEEYTTDAGVKTIYKKELSSQPGIMSLSLPQDLSGLKVGHKYRWKVVLRCTRYRAIVAMAEIEVVAATGELKVAQSQASEVDSLVDLYSNHGLWYDAIATTLNATDFEQLKLQNQLLQELAAIEIKSKSDSVQMQGEKLQEIKNRLDNSQAFGREICTYQPNGSI